MNGMKFFEALARDRARWAWTLVFACFLVPGIWAASWLLERIPRAGGRAGFLLFVLTSFTAIVVVVPWLLRWIPEKRWLGVPIALFIIAIVGLLTPNLDALRFGSDRNEALTVATQRLLSGQHPYGWQTSRGLPVTALPGGMVLSAPFVLLLGNAAYQNALCLLAFLAVVAIDTRRVSFAVALGVVVLCSPYVIYQIAVGEDLLSNSLYVALATYWLLVCPRGPKRGLAFLAAVCLGIALSWRTNFLLVAPVVLVALAGRHGARAALASGAGVALGFVVVTLPVYAMGPDQFAPLHVASRLRYDFIPYSETVLGAVLWTVSLVGAAVVHRNPGTYRVLLVCGAVVACQVLLIFVLNSLDRGSLSVGTLGYAIFAQFFLLLGALGSLVSTNEQPELADSQRL